MAVEMPAYSTIYNTLKSLATQEATVTRDHAHDKELHGFLQFDSMQNYTRQRSHRVGHTNRMNIGIAATYCELEGVGIDAPISKIGESVLQRISMLNLVLGSFLP